MRLTTQSVIWYLGALGTVRAYWLMDLGKITVERLDPIVNPREVTAHVHAVFGGSNFGMTTNTEKLRQSVCTSAPIVEDKSNYWVPNLYFEWKNGSVSSVDGRAVVYYLFPDKAGGTKAFPPNFRMMSGDPTLRSYDPSSFAQQAIDFLCLDFTGTTTKHSKLPEQRCPSGMRSQVNFPSCWDGENLDSDDHKSHVAFLSDGPDSGECADPKYPVKLPRLFMEAYWGTQEFDAYRSQAKNPDQPFIFSQGDPTGYGNHADFFNGWQEGVLQRAVDGCNCNIYGSFDCCVEKGLFTKQQSGRCQVTPTLDEQTTGTLPRLPGNNPVQYGPGKAAMFTDIVTPGIISPVFAYTGNAPLVRGKVITPPRTAKDPTSTSPSPAILKADTATLSTQSIPKASNLSSHRNRKGGHCPSRIARQFR